MRVVMVAFAASGVVCSGAVAAPMLDGVRDGQYGSAAAVQTVQTGFGDGNPMGGSELDAGYGFVEGGFLYLILTGNLENNFNKLNIFIDSVAGGQNTLQNVADSGGNNPNNDNWAGRYAGFTFDTGFEADYMLIARNGNSGGDRFDLDFATIGGGLGAWLTSGPAFGASLTGSNASALANGIGVAFNNSNSGGVIGGTGAADQMAAAAVTTGIELAIPLSAIGNPVGEIKVSAMINGSNHDFLSNQFLGGMAAGQGNVGGDGNGTFTGTVGQLDLNDFAGQQWFRVVPSPAGVALFGIAGVVGMRRRRG